LSKSVEGPNLYGEEHKPLYWHIMTTDEVLKETNSQTKGLTETKAKETLDLTGKNSIIKKEKFKLLKSLIEKFNSVLIWVLLSTALISLYLDHVMEFYVILVIVLFTITLSFIQEFRAEKSVEALSKLTAKKVEVLRDGKKKQILAEDLVVGDIVILHRGLIVPADLRILESNGLRINESILTGESVPKGKISTPLKDHEVSIADRDNMAYSGTSIMNGSGLGIVIATGFNSEIGKISKKLTLIGNQKTPLQKKLDVMTSRISYAVILLCVAVYFTLLLKGTATGPALLLVAALAVSAIPEGFPLALTLALSSGVKRMAENNAVVKDMGSVETLGTTTVICTDKTGTLTQNKMMAVKVNFNSKHDIQIEGKPYEPLAKFKLDGIEIQKEDLQKRHDFFYTSILCNNAEITNNEGTFELSGEPTEGALLGLASSAGFDFEVVREENKRVHEEAFDSTKKYMVTINEENKTLTAYLKGAVEKVLQKSTHTYKHGKLVKLDETHKKEILNKVSSYTQDSLRVLALATKHFKTKDKAKAIKESSEGYIFLGIVGIEDPIREDVIDAIAQCKSAGIRTVMVTGDHKSTAIAIGKQLGLIQSKFDIVLEGHEIDELSNDELDAAMPNVKIFARTTPDHKLRIVESQQRLGEIVAMTGDGVNDAPALKKADIGVSMGIAGTDVARESSNMILMDDAFSTIVKAVREGRTIYSNIRRVIYYMLTINIAEALIILAAIMFNFITPLTAIMILFINVITSTIPSFGLSLEPTNNKVMEYKPRDPKEKLLSEYILLRLVAVSPLLVMIALGFFLWELNFGSADLDRARTLTFATIVVFELFHVFNARSLHTTVFKSTRFFGNKYIFISVITSIFILIASIQTEFGRQILQTTTLTGFDWMLIIILGSSALITSEIIKLLINIEMKEQSKLQGRPIHF
jgi:P-type Ca2+ transporter type 2C